MVCVKKGSFLKLSNYVRLEKLVVPDGYWNIYQCSLFVYQQGTVALKNKLLYVIGETTESLNSNRKASVMVERNITGIMPEQTKEQSMWKNTLLSIHIIITIPIIHFVHKIILFSMVVTALIFFLRKDKTV